MSHPPSREADKVMVRMPDGLRPWIAEEAKRNHRSANAQIVWMLQRMRAQIELINEARLTWDDNVARELAERFGHPVAQAA